MGAPAFMATAWDWSPDMHALHDHMMKKLKPHFVALTPAKANKLARKMLDDLFAERRRSKRKHQIACQATECFGCCLHQIEVDTCDYEVDRIISKVAEDGRLEEVTKRAETVSSTGKGGACPLLGRDGRCTVYRIRPVSCAAYHSLDRKPCHDGPKGQPVHDKDLWVSALAIAGCGITEINKITLPGVSPRTGLFASLASRGRARLERRKAA